MPGLGARSAHRGPSIRAAEWPFGTGNHGAIDPRRPRLSFAATAAVRRINSKSLNPPDRSSERTSRPLVGSFVLLDHVGGNAAALVDLHAVILGPGADAGRLLPGPGRARPPTAGAAGPRLAGVGHERLQALTNLLRVLGAHVYLISGAAQAELHRLFGVDIALVQVTQQHDLYLLGHLVSSRKASLPRGRLIVGKADPAVYSLVFNHN